MEIRLYEYTYMMYMYVTAGKQYSNCDVHDDVSVVEYRAYALSGIAKKTYWWKAVRRGWGGVVCVQCPVRASCLPLLTDD